MKLHYDPETDSLYIDFNSRPGANSQEVAEGVVLDFDQDGQIVGIDIQHASQIVDLTTLEGDWPPGTTAKAATNERHGNW